MILRLMSGKLSKSEEKIDKKRIRWETTPVTREVLVFGIQPFLHGTQKKEQESKTKPVIVPKNKDKQMPEMGNFVQSQCVEFLSARLDSIVQVESVLPPFTAKENMKHWHRVLREIKAQEGFAIIGMVLPHPGKTTNIYLFQPP